jgi:hypothetical protein
VVKEEEGTHRNDASKEGNGAEGVAIVKLAIRHGKAFAYSSLSSPTHRTKSHTTVEECRTAPIHRPSYEVMTELPAGTTSPTGAANHLHHQHWAPAPQSRLGSSHDATTTKHAGGIRQLPASLPASRVVTRISRTTRDGNFPRGDPPL